MPCQKKENSAEIWQLLTSTRKDQELLPWRGGDRAEPQKSCEKLDQLEKREKEILSSRHTMQNQDVFLQSSLDYFKDYNLEANRECEHLKCRAGSRKGALS